MFKSWYSNFYNQLTKFSNNNNNNSNTFTKKNNNNSNNNDNCEFKNSQNNLSQVVYFNMATNNQPKPNKSKLSSSNNSNNTSNPSTSTTSYFSKSSNQKLNKTFSNSNSKPHVTSTNLNSNSKITGSKSLTRPNQLIVNQSKNNNNDKPKIITPIKNNIINNNNINLTLTPTNNNLINNSFQSLVHYGDNIGAKVVKCLINESLYESQSLINQDYDIYQVN
jgi:hypothetical protein